jgi:hypothetical protein
MSPQFTAAIVAVTLIAIAVIVWFALRARRSEGLRRRFGPEYERAAHELGDVRKAEAALEARVARVGEFHIRPLSRDDAERFAAGWRDVQRRFVDDPNGAAIDADRLIGEVMHVRGYPIGDENQRIDDVSVDHPHVVTHYRAARDIVRRRARGEASTEDLRQAMVHYRALFDELLEPPAVPIAAERARQDERELTRGRR